MLDDAPIAFTAVDAGGTIQFQAGRLFRELGYPDDVVGRTAPEVFSEVATASTILAKALTGEISVAEVEMGGRNVAIHFNPTRDENGQMLGLTAVTLDLTERRRAEADLQAAKSYLDSLIRQSPVVILEIERPGTPDDPAVYVSPNIERLFGYPPDEVIGTPGWFIARVHPDDLAGVVAAMGEAAAAGREMVIQFRARHRDGNYRWLLSRGFFTAGADGTPARMLAYATDVTDQVEAEEGRRRAEEQLERAARLESLGRLAGGVAHDFNNLLAVIMANAEFARGELPTDLALPGSLADRCRKVRGYVAEIEWAAARAADLTGRLLSFGRSDQTEPEVIHLGVVITDVESVLRRVLSERIDLAVRVGADIWPVLADPGLIEQAVLNLAANGEDAMPEGGRLVVDLANVELGESRARRHEEARPGRFVSLTVTDTGTGMQPELASRAFEPFLTTKERGQGSGLGLSTVHGTVHRAGGWIEIDSVPGRGTTVALYLPAVETGADPQPPATPRPPPRPARDQTVLVVDDEEGVREAARGILARHGYRVMTTPGPAGALELCADRKAEIGMLVTDVVMPGMTGIELAERARDLRPGLPVLFMSGYPGDVIPEEPRLRRDGHLVSKPFSSERLVRMVGEIFGAAEDRP